MTSYIELNYRIMNNKWEKWLANPIQYEEYECNIITNKQYLENVFHNLIHIFEKRGIIFLVRTPRILNDVMNYYFNLWRYHRKNVYNYDILTKYGRERQKKHSLPSIEIIDYLDRIFSDVFWESFRNEYGVNAGLFDYAMSDFGSAFWTDIRYFLYQYINPVNLKNIHGISEFNMNQHSGELGRNENEDPYIVDMVNSNKAGIYE